MNSVLMLLALSAGVGFVLGTALTWYAILMSGAVLAILSAAVLHSAGFGAVAGIGIIVVCLIVNQAAYLLGLMRHTSLAPEQADEEPRAGRDDNIARENKQKQTAQSDRASKSRDRQDAVL
jgi:hypothetical protein